MVTLNSTEAISSFPDTWNGLNEDQRLDMDAFYESDLLDKRRNEFKGEFIANCSSGSISLVASILLSIHILRSHHGLPTTYHRIVFGLSSCDIMSSLAFTLSSIVVPKEMGYLVPFAIGNNATCEAQTFFMYFGIAASCLYNCSICFYYLAIITFNKKDDYIRRNFEPLFHCISISIPLVLCIVFSARNAGNGPNGGTCSVRPYNPPHCFGYEKGEIPDNFSIPCFRGGSDPLISVADRINRYIIWAPFGVIVVTMTLMYRSVTIIERRMQNYGVNTLRTKVALGSADNTSQQEEPRCFLSKLMGMLKGYFKSTKTRSNTVRSQKRAVLHMAIAYAASWLLVYGTYSLLRYKYSSGPLFYFWLHMHPLQGFFNFLVFMGPKVRDTRKLSRVRRRETDLTWSQAFLKVYMSRGPARPTDRTLTRSRKTSI